MMQKAAWEHGGSTGAHTHLVWVNGEKQRLQCANENCNWEEFEWLMSLRARIEGLMDWYRVQEKQRRRTTPHDIAERLSWALEGGSG